eukprot:2761400-Pleurochrysis_carterae.AAC.1
MSAQRACGTSAPIHSHVRILSSSVVRSESTFDIQTQLKPYRLIEAQPPVSHALISHLLCTERSSRAH